jgi:cell division protein FtsQ
MDGRQRGMRRLTTTTARRRRRPEVPHALYRIGLWIGGLVLMSGCVYGAVQLNRSLLVQSLLQGAADKLVQGTGLLGLTIADIRVEGRETTDRETILAALAAGPGTPILAVNPARAKAQLETLPWVRKAVIERRLPSTLYVRLVERKPLALWQHGGKLELIDREGAAIPTPRLDRFAKLPLVVGEGAAGHAAELLEMLASEPELAARVTAAVRVGDRRWNLRIDNTVDVLLPAEAAASAWSQLARIERSSAVLKREVQTIDMRLSDRLVLRVSAETPKEVPISRKGRPSGKNT